eukprot:4738239-Prorocentrum_lima.AAC.1
MSGPGHVGSTSHHHAAPLSLLVPQCQQGRQSVGYCRQRFCDFDVRPRHHQWVLVQLILDLIHPLGPEP